MTQAFNLALLANNVNSSGQLNADAGLYNTVNVANGGTNLSDVPTNGQLLIGNGTGYTLATLTAGAGVDITNGGGSISLSAPAASGTRGQVFTSSGTFTVPSGVSSVKVTIIGGGGGGGATTSNSTVSSGGGAGGYGYEYITGLVAGAAISVTVGAGGGAGAAGGTSSFGAYCSATGGAAGASRGASSVGTTNGGSGGSASGASFSVSGGAGASVSVTAYACGCSTQYRASPGAGGCAGVGTTNRALVNSVGILGGSGGDSPGTSTTAGGPNRSGNAGTIIGNGGSGSYRLNSTATAGSGAAGLVIVEW